VNHDGTIQTIEGNTGSGRTGSQRDGDGGDPVRRVQSAVHVPVDGGWGPVTDRAVCLVRAAARGSLGDVRATQRAVGTADDGD
jgi:hypothetical protein